MTRKSLLIIYIKICLEVWPLEYHSKNLCGEPLEIHNIPPSTERIKNT